MHRRWPNERTNAGFKETVIPDRELTGRFRRWVQLRYAIKIAASQADTNPSTQIANTHGVSDLVEIRY